MFRKRGWCPQEPFLWLPIPLKDGINFGREVTSPLDEVVVQESCEVDGESVDGRLPPLPLLLACVLEEGGEFAGKLVVEMEPLKLFIGVSSNQ